MIEKIFSILINNVFVEHVFFLMRHLWSDENNCLSEGMMKSELYLKFTLWIVVKFCVFLKNPKQKMSNMILNLNKKMYKIPNLICFNEFNVTISVYSNHHYLQYIPTYLSFYDCIMIVIIIVIMFYFYICNNAQGIILI